MERQITGFNVKLLWSEHYEIFGLPALAKEESQKGEFALSEAEGRVWKFERLSLRLVKNFVQ
jgi:hypothetical protein